MNDHITHMLSAITSMQDENQDGVFTVGEFRKWIEDKKIVKLMEEGRDAELDHIVATQQAESKKEEQAQKSD